MWGFTLSALESDFEVFVINEILLQRLQLVLNQEKIVCNSRNLKRIVGIEIQ